jgi:hypothetical protein
MLQVYYHAWSNAAELMMPQLISFGMLNLTVVWNWCAACAESTFFPGTFGLDKFCNSDLFIDTTVYEILKQDSYETIARRNIWKLAVLETFYRLETYM